MLPKIKRDEDLLEAIHGCVQAELSIQHMSELTELKQERVWKICPEYLKPYYKALLPENLGTHNRECLPGKVNADRNQTLTKANDKPHDTVIYTDGSTTRD